MKLNFLFASIFRWNKSNFSWQCHTYIYVYCWCYSTVFDVKIAFLSLPSLLEWKNKWKFESFCCVRVGVQCQCEKNPAFRSFTCEKLQDLLIVFLHIRLRKIYACLWRVLASFWVVFRESVMRIFKRLWLLLCFWGLWRLNCLWYSIKLEFIEKSLERSTVLLVWGFSKWLIFIV